ncbi:MAG: DUF4337 domain-containing protein [Magnetococcales bacterium]|nr:DUF4337 domain-containing protein [Magnetococcales bacterium]
MEAHETHEMMHHAAHGGHEDHAGQGHGASNRNKLIAVLISIMACILSIVEIGANSSQNTSLAANIDASNLWAFYQAKTVRMTLTRSFSEMLETTIPDGLSVDKSAAWKKRIADFQATSQRMDSEPQTGEGRKELMVKAKAAEALHKKALHAYHLYEYSAAAMQIGIVLASASAATGVLALLYLASGLAVVGTAIGAVAWLAPTLIHL